MIPVLIIIGAAAAGGILGFGTHKILEAVTRDKEIRADLKQYKEKGKEKATNEKE